MALVGFPEKSDGIILACENSSLKVNFSVDLAFFLITLEPTSDKTTFDNEGVLAMSEVKTRLIRSQEPQRKPITRLQRQLINLKQDVVLFKEMLSEFKWEKIELSVYRTIVIVHLLKYLLYSIWH